MLRLTRRMPNAALSRRQRPSQQPAPVSDAAADAKDAERCSESAAAAAAFKGRLRKPGARVAAGETHWGTRGVVDSVFAYVAMHALGVKDLAD